MARWMMILCLVCLAGAVGVSLWPDPWVKADQKAVQDADLLADLVSRPDRIGWRLTEDLTLTRAVIWNSKGVQQYPPSTGFAPLQYEFSEDEIRNLTALQPEVAVSEWGPFDTSDKELFYCRAKPAVCVFYDRAILEETLGLKAGALSKVGNGFGWRSLWAALAAVFGAAALWFRKRARLDTGRFSLQPERHSATRGALEVSLSPRDLKLLMLLEGRDGAVVTKDELYDAGWGRDFMPNSRALDQHMINLRRKLDPDKSRPVLIETVHGVGYRLLR